MVKRKWAVPPAASGDRRTQVNQRAQSKTSKMKHISHNHKISAKYETI